MTTESTLSAGPDLIIFDCDGVLIDSEALVCRLVSEEFTRLGYPLSVEQVIERFAGRPEREMLAEIALDWGRAIPDDYEACMTSRIAEAYRTDLRAMAGAAEAIASMRVPVCVASSSAPGKLRLGLACTGLEALLAPNLVSAAFVGRGKPAPDVFIYAAGWMRTPVDRCLVIEDSLPGVEAAREAGMRVVGFVGGAHCPPGHATRLRQRGAEGIVEAFSDLRAYLPGIFERGA